MASSIMAAARQYARINQRAIGAYRRIAEENGIDCMLEQRDAYTYGLTDAEPLRQEAQAAAALGLPATFCDAVRLPFPVAGAVRFTGQAQFHPLRFLYGVSDKLRIFEHSPVAEVEDNALSVNGYTVTADKIVFATHYPFINFPGLYFTKMYQSRSYILALENAAPIDGMFVGAAEGDLSLRTAGRLLLFCRRRFAARFPFGLVCGGRLQQMGDERFYGSGGTTCRRDHRPEECRC